MSNSRKRHTPEQVVRKLGQADRMLADGQDVAAVCRELGVSEQTYYRWADPAPTPEIPHDCAVHD